MEVLEGHPPDWKEYLESLVGQKVEDDERIIVRNPRYVVESSPPLLNHSLVIVTCYQLTSTIFVSYEYGT